MKSDSTRVVADEPETSAAPPTVTSVVPFALSVQLTLAKLPSWSSSVSRWSSRSFGWLPVVIAAVIVVLSAAMRWPIELICEIVSVTARPVWLVTTPIWPERSRKPVDRACAFWASAARLAPSSGALATSCQEEKNLESSELRPLLPGSLRAPVICCSPSWRAWA